MNIIIIHFIKLHYLVIDVASHNLLQHKSSVEMEIIMFKIISDTACDYTLDYANSIDVTLVPFYVTFDEKNYYKDLYELSVEDFYQKIINNKIYPKTSLPSVQDYTDTFLPYV